MSSKTTRFESLLEAVPEALVGLDQKGVIQFVNQQTESLFGYDRNQLIGQPIEMLVPESLWQLHAEHREDHVAAPGASSGRLEVELVGRQRDGTDIPVNVTVSGIDTGDLLAVITAVRDVARRRQAVQTAQRLAAIIECSDDAIVSRTLDGIITSWNPAAERMFGYPSDEIVGKTSDLLIPADRAAETLSILAKISAGRPVREFETVRLRKDGTQFPVSLTISPIRDEKGAIISVSVICRDITEARHAARYSRSLLEAALDPLVTISPEGKINDVNEATVRITGVPRHKLIGTDFSRYFTDPDKAREGYQQVFAQGAVTNYPLTLRHRDGTQTGVLYNASVYCDEGGKVLGVFAAARDMTNQREAFEATQRMAAIVEYSDEALISNTLDGIITSWNPAAERMFGYTSDEIVGRSGTLLSPRDRTDEIKEILATVSAGRAVDDFETLCTRKDGSTFPVKLTLTPVRDVGGKIVGASAIVRDVYAIAREQIPPR
jgi:PAS domain S-box-containing protein